MSHWLAHERLTIHMHEALGSQETRPRRHDRTRDQRHESACGWTPQVTESKPSNRDNWLG